MTLTSQAFWAATAERAAKTFAQALSAGLLADGTGIIDTSWVPLLSMAGMAALLSVLTSIASASAADGQPSLGSVEVLAAPGVEAAPVTGTPVEVVADDRPDHLT